MFQAALLALSQMASPPFRRVLLKSTGLALLVVALLGIGLHRVFAWLASGGTAWAETSVGVVPHAAWEVLVWVLSIAAGLGIVAGGIFLMPAVAAFAGTFFVDEIAEAVERMRYSAEPPGLALPLGRAIFEGLKTALVSVAVYLAALPFLLFAGFGFVVMFLAAAYLLSREYFLLAAMRFHPPDAAKRMRREHRLTVFLAGLFIATFVSIPVINLATPLFATAMMVHLHKRLAGRSEAPVQPRRA